MCGDFRLCSLLCLLLFFDVAAACGFACWVIVLITIALTDWLLWLVFGVWFVVLACDCLVGSYTLVVTVYGLLVRCSSWCLF